MHRVLVLLAAIPLFAQNITIGTLPQTAAYTLGSANPETYVDMSHPATGAGAISSVEIRWSAPASTTTCDGAFKVKFVRPSSAGTAFTIIAERGPFRSSNGVLTVPISPAVNVEPRDLIGITSLVSAATCGSITSSAGRPSERYWVARSDIGTTTNDFNNGSLNSGTTLNAMGKSTTEALVGIIPAVGAAQGVGAFFRTSMQITNPDYFSPIKGRLVYHPQGLAATDSDPSLVFTLSPNQTASYPDIITQMGLAGIGSMDLLSTSGPMPVISTRVFSDNGSAGTLGFTEDVVVPDDALAAAYGTINIPADTTNFRMSVGVRSLSAARIAFTYFDAAGNLVAYLPQRTYAANYFEQVPLGSLLGSFAIVPNGTVQIYVFSGRAIVYTTTTDNRTSDSAMKVIR